jgi:hypothetical protein
MSWGADQINVKAQSLQDAELKEKQLDGMLQGTDA